MCWCCLSSSLELVATPICQEMPLGSGCVGLILQTNGRQSLQLEWFWSLEFTEHISYFFNLLWSFKFKGIVKTRPIIYAWNRNSHDPFKGLLRVLGIITGYPKFQLHRRSMNPLRKTWKKLHLNWISWMFFFFEVLFPFKYRTKRGWVFVLLWQ